MVLASCTPSSVKTDQNQCEESLKIIMTEYYACFMKEATVLLLPRDDTLKYIIPVAGTPNHCQYALQFTDYK